MEPVKVVARYINGRRVKGFSQDFFPNKDRFHVYPPAKPSGEAAEVLLKELKAIFFVKDFAGNYMYNERKEYMQGESLRSKGGSDVQGWRGCGRTTLAMTQAGQAFIFPADPKCNNIQSLPCPAVKVRFCKPVSPVFATFNI
jgi:hypothetical protein